LNVSSFKRRYRVIVTVAITAVGIPAVVLGVFMIFYHVQIGRLSAVVEEKAARSQAREYQRDPDTPGWKLEDGSAASYYEQAWDSCWPYSQSGGERGSRGRMAAVMTGRPWNNDNDPIVKVEAAVFTPECEALGVTAETVDPVTAQLNRDLCVQYTDCEEALALIRRGSRQADARSPGSIWSGWLVEPGSNSPRMWSFFQAYPRLELLRAHLAGQRGDRPEMLASWASNLRFGNDLTRGSGMIGAMTYETVQRPTLLVIGQEILRETLTLEEARQLAAEVAYVRQQPIDRVAIHEDLQLETGSMMPLRTDLVVPGSVMGLDTKLPPQHAALLVLATSGILDTWERRIEIQELPYRERVPANLSINEANFGHWNPWVQGQFWPTSTDTRIVSVETHLLLTELALTETVYRRENGRPPATIAELESVNPDLDLIDPLSNEEILLVEEDGRRFLCSPALAQERLSELEIDRWALHHGDLDYLKIELPPQSNAGTNTAINSSGSDVSLSTP